MILMYLCGLRVGKIFDLNLDSIDTNEKTIYVLGKGKKHRILHLSNELFQILSEYFAIRKSFYLSYENDAMKYYY